jgi:ectoine hydroxylase-related dioxygenase (phytanoyl-CoA dioxygenase family)
MQREDGYLLLKRLVPREAVLAGRQHIVEQMQGAGWVAPEEVDLDAALLLAPAPTLGETQPPSLLYLHEEAGAGAGGDPAKLNGGVARFRPSANEAGPNSFIAHPAVARVAEAPEMHAVCQRLLGAPEVATLDYKWLRIMLPHQTTSFHVDHCFFHEDYRRQPATGASSAAPAGRSQRESDEQGAPQILTAWLPWCDTDIQTGGLAVLRGSNSLSGFERLRRSYCDVDVSNTDISDASFFSEDPRELLKFDSRAQWVTANYEAGDVLLFGMHTFHGGVVNNSQQPARVRLSSDIRFFPAATPMDARYSLPRQAQRENVHEGPAWRTMAEAKAEWGLQDAPPAKL